jgi:hypothetical protein
MVVEFLPIWLIWEQNYAPFPFPSIFVLHEHTRHSTFNTHQRQGRKQETVPPFNIWGGVVVYKHAGHFSPLLDFNFPANAESAAFARSRAVWWRLWGLGGVREKDVGPVQRAVQSFGRTRSFVVGACGECSKDLLKLLDDTAAAQEVKDWRSNGMQESGGSSGRAGGVTRTNSPQSRLSLDCIDLYMDAGAALCNAEVLQEPSGKTYDGLHAFAMGQ